MHAQHSRAHANRRCLHACQLVCSRQTLPVKYTHASNTAMHARANRRCLHACILVCRRCMQHRRARSTHTHTHSLNLSLSDQETLEGTPLPFEPANIEFSVSAPSKACQQLVKHVLKEHPCLLSLPAYIPTPQYELLVYEALSH